MKPDDYYIDLRLEPRRETDRACLIGQILTRQGMDRAAAGISVRIQNGKVLQSPKPSPIVSESSSLSLMVPSVCIFRLAPMKTTKSFSPSMACEASHWNQRTWISYLLRVK